MMYDRSLRKCNGLCLATGGMGMIRNSIDDCALVVGAAARAEILHQG